ncbi:uncharacterized protein K460DRAFT_178677 [Cucurbitaria berberidis CBS 394.84]|uniref:Uncharacterized protein n=1 Tax=Cucurbitaria berberidis CBS 394.84 TaxID=1168544 RepID=A0A9P4L591_9PLEO|nr:uncharacterized protein K460DRAFT_178677 [Cucurbitaria berberidis CBS 394.84]KAF1842089.1 hypothetical protein K460DRAFT_178677 [Cucurbitaria berberidis CBS 394.84]
MRRWWVYVRSSRKASGQGLCRRASCGRWVLVKRDDNSGSLEVNHEAMARQKDRGGNDMKQREVSMVLGGLCAAVCSTREMRRDRPRVLGPL